jgi:hypothetical protein
MSDGKNCPQCGHDIGLRAVLLAAWPTRVTCPHCKTRLSYGSGLVLATCLIALVAAAFYLVSLKYRVSEFQFHVVLIGSLLAVLIPFEVFASLYLRLRGRLRKAN